MSAAGNSSPGRVVALFISPQRGEPMRACERVQAQAGHGFEDDAHARPGGRRQVLLVEAETLRELKVASGAVKENITTEGIRLAALQAGDRLRVDEALLEVTVACTPCAQMDAVQPGLQEKIHGRRGMLARVVEGGAIRLDDTIRILGT